MAQKQATSTKGPGTPDLRKVVDNQSVGEILLNGRLARGEDLAQVAEGLKIRRTFIEALENDEFGALPGTAYGIGFVRAYADYLDLDSKEIVALYKAQSQAFNDQTQLVFPEPMPGSRVPTVLVILLSLLLIGAAYGGWTVLSEKDRTIADLVPAVPQFLKDLQTTASESVSAEDNVAADPYGSVSDAQTTSVTTTTEPDYAATTETVEPAQDAAETATAVTQAETVAETVAENAAEETASDASAAVQAEAEAVVGSNSINDAVEPVADDTTNTVAASGSDPVVSDTEAANSTADLAEPAPVVEEGVEDSTEAVIDDAQATVAAIIPEAPTGEVTVYGETEGPSRVSVVARQATWVEISDADGSILLTRLLRKGDIYKAPMQDGLTLVTGNAGGLGFLVDGQIVPDVGPVGSVRRDVSLSPEALMAGPAATEGQ